MSNWSLNCTTGCCFGSLERVEIPSKKDGRKDSWVETWKKIGYGQREIW